MAFVYWIHLPEHTDMFSEGYVGITSKTVAERYKGHKKESRRSRSVNMGYPVYHAMRKYGETLIVTTILEGHIDYCSVVEEKLRPTVKIGWNIHVGGNKGFMGSTHSDETKKKLSEKSKGRVVSDKTRKLMSILNTGKKHTPEARQKMSEDRTGVKRSKTSVENHKNTLKNQPWRNSKAIKNNWLIADKLFEIYNEDRSISAKKLGAIVNLTECNVINILLKFRSGWEPTKDDFWLTFKNENEKDFENVGT